MRMLMNIRIPHEPFNTLVKEGKAGEILKKIIRELQPEFIYFTEQGGTRGAVAGITITDPSQIPSFSEPFSQILMLIASLELQCRLKILGNPDLTSWVKNGAN